MSILYVEDGRNIEDYGALMRRMVFSQMTPFDCCRHAAL